MNHDFSCLRSSSGSFKYELDKGRLTDSTGRYFPVVNGIPRFVDAENYSSDFGKQWNRFPKTQLDSYTGLDVSRSRLQRCFRGHLPEVKGKRVLEAGSGAGRFTELLLEAGSVLHSFDYSNAVEANACNNGHHHLLTLVQADIRSIPFEKESYDFVVCLGVLQHTPNPEQSIKALWDMLKPGGTLVADHYMRKWRIILPPPIGQALGLYRQVILRLPKGSRFRVVKALTDFWFPLHWKFRDSWVITRLLRRISPVVFHYPDIRLQNRAMHYEWALLDTHDSTTDFFKHYRSPTQIKKFLEGLGAKEISVTEGGNGVEIFCIK